MTEALHPKSNSKSFYRIKPTITIPYEWKEKIEEYMRKKGFQDYAELFRYLIRRIIIDSSEG